MSGDNWLKAELDQASKEVANWPTWKREAMKVASPSDEESKTKGLVQRAVVSSRIDKAPSDK